jgi:heme exporter protein D
MDLGPHAAFILASYGAFVLVLAVLLIWLFADGKRQTDALAALEARGVNRRGSRSDKTGNNGMLS